MRNAKYFFRTDANPQIGAGHLMRCLTIGEALKQSLQGDEEILFVCADEQSAQLAGERGFQTKVLHSDYRDMEAELPLWEEIFKAVSHKEGEAGLQNGKETAPVIVADSYYVTSGYLGTLRRYGQVILLDDLQREAFPVDAVINYNAFADGELYRKLYRGRNTKLYLGSSYVPLRRQFSQRQENAEEALRSQADGFVRKVLITTGGSDKDNIAGQILHCLDREDVEFHLVVGRLSPYFAQLKELESEKKNVALHYDVENMAELMAGCDLAVTAGGTTVYELCAVGVPFICFSYAENQEAIVRYLGEKQIAGEAGAFHKDKENTLKRMKELFGLLCGDGELRQSFRQREQSLTDGQGAFRIAGILREGRE